MGSLTLAAVLVAASAVGCGQAETCSNRTSDGLIITVTDGAGGPAICGATVTAHDGAYVETLVPIVPIADCTYQGARERSGTYTIDVVSGTRTAEVSGVTVIASQCTVVTRPLTIPLPP